MKKLNKFSYLNSFIAICVSLISIGPVCAAGTTIANTAAAAYNLELSTGLTATGSTLFVVDNIINLTVTDNADENVTPGSTNEALGFVVRNDGNTTQRYALSAINSSGFIMENVRIYLDTGTIPNAWDTGDTLYMDASTFGDLPSDGTLNILIVADTPGGANNGQTSDYTLIATTVDAGTTNITSQTSGPNTAGVDVVFADISGTAPVDTARDGEHSATGRYTVITVSVIVTKSVLIYSDPYNGAVNGTPPDYTDCSVCPEAMTGATLRYTLSVNVQGSGTALDVVITDPIPYETTYSPGTLTLNAAGLSDISDADAGDAGDTISGAVTVNLGEVISGPPAQIITFDVTIN